MPKSKSLEQQLNDIILFCREKAKELKGIDPNSIPLNDRMAHFAHISDRTGETYVEVGMDARRQIQEWCFSYLQRRGWVHLISVSQCAEQVEEVIAYKFFKMRKAINDGSISKMIHGLDDSIRNGVKPYRFIWQCHICFGANPSEFLIGDVRFRPTEFGKDDIDSALNSWKSGINGFREKIENYYISFGWIADVTVHTSDPAAAKRISLLAVQTALSVLKILMGKGPESRVRMSEHQNYLRDRAELHFIAGEPHLTWHQDGQQAPFAPTWWEDLNQGSNAIRLRTLDQIVRSVVRPAEQTFLKRKYLSALQWFNDGSLDTYASSRIAKFVTVLETLTSCNERDDLAEKVGERVACLIAGWPDEGTSDEIKSKVKRVYVIRSELLHGERDPIGLELSIVAHEAGHLANMAMVAFLDFLIQLGIDRDDYNHAKLIADFLIIKTNVEKSQESNSIL